MPHHLRFLVVVYDLHPKWPEVAPVGSVMSSSIIAFLESLFAHWGLPSTLMTDNGSQLVSAEFTSYIQSKGIKHIQMAYYHPQLKGGMERFNQSLKNGLSAHLAEGCSFNNALSQTLLHYRAAQHATTGVSPAKWMLRRELKLPLHRCCLPTSHSGNPVVQARVHGQQPKAQGRYNTKKKAQIPEISLSDWVQVQRLHRSNILHTLLSKLQQVRRQLGPATFQLSDGFRWHASRLRKVQCPSGGDQFKDIRLSPSCPLFRAQHPLPPQTMDLAPPAELQGWPERPSLYIFRTT